MDLGVRGKVALVGGARRGLGLAICKRLAEEGVDLLMVSRAGEALAAQANQLARTYGIRAVPVAADLSTPAGTKTILDRAAEEFEAVDILIHNTGGPPPGAFTEHDDATWERAFESLLLSVVRLCRGVLPTMMSRGWGRIVVNTSFTVREPADRLILSNVFRTGAVALAKTLSREVAHAGVTVNCVCPGAFATERLDSILEEEARTQHLPVQEVREAWTSRIPIGRVLQPAELAALVAFLASDLAGGITGACYPIEGGMLHGLF